MIFSGISKSTYVIHLLPLARQQCQQIMRNQLIRNHEHIANILVTYSPSIIQGDSKNMSPLAFKSNNSRPMSRTTLPDTAFERADNMLSNECIHPRFPFQIASSQAEKQKSSGFCVFRFQTDFDEREHFVLSSHYRNIAFICSVKCAQNIPVPPEPPSSSHLT